MAEKKEKCLNCNKEVEKESKFCKECGTKINKEKEEVKEVAGEVVEEIKKENQSNPTEQTANQKRPPIIIAGFICALCGLITCGMSSFVGLVLSVIGFEESKKKGISDGLAIAGIVISGILILLLGVPFVHGFIKGVESGIDNPGTEEKDSKVTKKKIKVIDFSTMTQEEIKTWCNEANIYCNFKNEYSDTIDMGGFISQSVEPEKTIEEKNFITIVYSLGKEPTVSQKNAVRSAESYIRHMAFSREGLISQLEYEKYSREDAEYAVDHITVDWNEQAVKSAESYLRHMSFSREGLIDQLLYEGFTYEQAVYGVEQNGL